MKESKDITYKSTQEELDESLDFIERELEKIRQLMKGGRKIKIPGK